MNQPDLWYDSLSGALLATVEALGPKKVASALWHLMSVDDARRKLLNSLNPERNEKLGLEEIEHILKMAREREIHTAMLYLTDALHYQPARPVEPDDEKARLQREYVQAVKTLEELTKRIERV